MTGLQARLRGPPLGGPRSGRTEQDTTAAAPAQTNSLCISASPGDGWCYGREHTATALLAKSGLVCALVGFFNKSRCSSSLDAGLPVTALNSLLKWTRQLELRKAARILFNVVLLFYSKPCPRGKRARTERVEFPYHALVIMKTNYRQGGARRRLLPTRH